MPKEKKRVVPRLRFPEFRGADPWEVRTIEELSDKIAQGGTPTTSCPDYWNGDIPWITPAEMGDDAVHHYTETTLRTISTEGLRNSSAEVLPVNSVIISSRAPIGYVTVNKIPMATNQGCKGIVPKKCVYHEFLYFSLLNAKSRLHDLGAGAGFKEISATTLKTFSISVPKYPEQQKIADCLSSLDEVIELEAKRFEALKAHKKGLLQQLFPREGETAPRLRFPEFHDAGPWEVKKIEDFFEVRSSKRVLERDWKAEGVPFYRTRELVALRNNEPFNSKVFISEEQYDELAREYGIPKEGDFLVSGVGTLGIAYQVKAGDKFYFKDGNVLWFKNKGAIIPSFFLYCFESSHIQNQIIGQASISTVGTYTIQDAKKTRFACPPVESEQQKIADCLSSLDEVIALQAQKLEALKAHKKGLMQQLFPQEVG